MQRAFILAAALISTVGCQHNSPAPGTTLGDPKNAQNYGYTPIDPLPVNVKFPNDAIDRHLSRCYLDNFSNQTMRLAIGSVDASGTTSFGPVKIGVQDSNYVVVVDYILYQVSPFYAEVDSTVTSSANYKYSVLDVHAGVGPTTTATKAVPVYVGAGVRMIANVRVQSGTVDLSNLFGLAAGVSAKKLSGSLVFQTLGVTGPSIGSLITVPSKLDETTIQDALVALGTMKSKLYDDAVEVTPSVVGLYNTLGGGQSTVDAFVSKMLISPIPVKITNMKNCT